MHNLRLPIAARLDGRKCSDCRFDPGRRTRFEAVGDRVPDLSSNPRSGIEAFSLLDMPAEFRGSGYPKFTQQGERFCQHDAADIQIVTRGSVIFLYSTILLRFAPSKVTPFASRKASHAAAGRRQMQETREKATAGDVVV